MVALEVDLAVWVYETRQAEEVLHLLSCRVDIVRDAAGRARVMEVEHRLHLEQGNALGLLTQALIDARGVRSA